MVLMLRMLVSELVHTANNGLIHICNQHCMCMGNGLGVGVTTLQHPSISMDPMSSLYEQNNKKNNEVVD